MPIINWKPARTLADLDQGQRLRFLCLSMDLGIHVVNDPHVERDISSIDCLGTTEHVLVFEDQLCVATARLAFPNPDVARASRTRLGLELENAGVDLSGLHDISDQVAEISRLCVLKRWRGTAAVIRLYEGLYVVSRQRGVRYWVGGVDCRTSNLAEAQLMRSILGLRGAIDPRHQLAVVGKPAPAGQPGGTKTEFYTKEQLELAELGHSEGLPIAGALVAFTKRLGATCIGWPAMHPAFPRYVLPMLVDLDRLPEATLRMFDQSQLAPFVTARGSDVRRVFAGSIAS